MSKERGLLQLAVNSLKGVTPHSPVYVEAKMVIRKIKELLSQPEEKPAVIVDAAYIAASIEFMESQKADDAKEMVRLRDWFAGLAMQGFLTADEDHLIDENDIAEWAYDQADAMLKERDKSNG